MDIELYFQEQGAGSPLLLLHGNGENSGYFEKQLACFSAAYRVLAPDTRGHGRSPRGSAPFRLEQFAEDLRDFLNTQNIQKASILGFSDGGNIALLFALKYPERVEKLILNGANLRPAGVKLRVQLPIVLSYGLCCLGSLFSKKFLAKKEMLGLMVTQPHISPAALKRLDCPTLVLVGTRDMIRDRHSRRIAAAIPGARFLRLPGSHFIAAENSLSFNRAVLDFLRGGADL